MIPVGPAPMATNAPPAPGLALVQEPAAALRARHETASRTPTSALRMTWTSAGNVLAARFVPVPRAWCAACYALSPASATALEGARGPKGAGSYGLRSFTAAGGIRSATDTEPIVKESITEPCVQVTSFVLLPLSPAGPQNVVTWMPVAVKCNWTAAWCMARNADQEGLGQPPTHRQELPDSSRSAPPTPTVKWITPLCG